MRKIKNMDDEDNRVMQNLLAEDKDIFINFFKASALVDKNFNSEIRQRTKQLFENFTSKNFDEFILKVHKSMIHDCQELMASKNTKDVSTQTQSGQDVFTQTCPESENLTFHSEARGLTHLTAFRNKKRKTKFDPLKFLTDKKMNQDFYVIEFQSDDEVEEELSEKSFSLNKKNLDAVADTDLKKMSEHIELLNKMYDYPVLNMCTNKVN